MLPSLNPRQFPQFQPVSGRYHTHAIEAMRALRHVAGFRPLLYAVPDISNAAVPAGAPHEAKVTVPPQSYLWAIAATSSDTDGFDFQIRDNRNKRDLFGKRTIYLNASGQGSSQGIAHPLFILPKPRVVLAPGELTIQIFNRAILANTIQIVLYFAIPEA
jgi:hypothetical protein